MIRCIRRSDGQLHVRIKGIDRYLGTPIFPDFRRPLDARLMFDGDCGPGFSRTGYIGNRIRHIIDLRSIWRGDILHNQPRFSTHFSFVIHHRDDGRQSGLLSIDDELEFPGPARRHRSEAFRPYLEDDSRARRYLSAHERRLVRYIVHHRGSRWCRILFADS